MKSLEFKQGLYQLHAEPNFNYQLNRVIMWNGGELEEVARIAPNITDHISWKRELIALGDGALSEKRMPAAIAYYRMSEFFMLNGDEDKLKYYVKATEMFYEYYAEFFRSGQVQRLNVPYENITLPVMVTKAQGIKKGTILLHGGNDSYFEEMFPNMLYVAAQGYDVYLFEGPGQGGVLRVQGKHFTHEWERPVKAVLDHCALQDVTIIGISLGGMLAPRAAAFDERITKVVAWSIFPEFLDVVLGQIPPKAVGVVRFLLKHKMRFLLSPLMNWVNWTKRNHALFQWGVRHGMYAYEAKTIYDYLKKVELFGMTDVGPRIKQDILILGAKEDHFVDYRLIEKELQALPNVHSLTYRLFTNEEYAGNHCNLGNAKLAIDTIVNWHQLLLQRDMQIARMQHA